jgi:hypothetical protein
MTYWKFLRAGAVSPFTGYAWEGGTWAPSGRLQVCRTGVHACRAADLPYWLNAELWQFELTGPIVQAPHKVVATRGRAVARMPEWDSSAARDLAMACAVRTAGHAVDELTDSHLDDHAARLAEAVSTTAPSEWTSVAERCAEAASAREARQASRLCGYVLDAVEALEAYPVASSAYIAARAANQRSSASEADPYLAERAWQADWLAGRLGLGVASP